MLRLIATCILVLSTAAVVMAGLRLQDTLAQSDRLTEFSRPDEPQLIGADGQEAEPLRHFLPIFGTPPADTPTTEAPPLNPREIDFNYSLKGVIVSSDMRWAILGGPSGDVLVRETEEIGGGTLAKVHHDGIDIDLGQEMLRLTFDTSERVDVAKVETFVQVPVEGTQIAQANVLDPELQVVMFQGMTRAALDKLLQDAEQRRRSQGWIQ